MESLQMREKKYYAEKSDIFSDQSILVSKRGLLCVRLQFKSLSNRCVVYNFLGKSSPYWEHSPIINRSFTTRLSKCIPRSNSLRDHSYLGVSLTSQTGTIAMKPHPEERPTTCKCHSLNRIWPARQFTVLKFEFLISNRN